MNITLRLINTLLLAAILWALVEIRGHMPPTLGEMVRPGNAEQKKAVLFRRLYAVSVDVDNSPLEVQITH